MSGEKATFKGRYYQLADAPLAPKPVQRPHPELMTGSKRQVEDKLGRLRAAGVDPLFVPSMFLPKDPRPLLDRFIGEIAPAFR